MAGQPEGSQTKQQVVLDTILHALLEERALVDDPDWDTVAVLVSVTPEAADMTAYRYAGAGRPTPTPLRNVPCQLFRDLQQATAGPDGSTWEVCIIEVDRDSGRGAVNFVYAADAGPWRVTPQSAQRIAEALRPRPADLT